MKSGVKQGGGRRLLSLLLCLTMVAGFIPALSPGAKAEESWVEPYLNKLVDWGIMRGDQAGNLDPNRSISRAEFVSMINRAYGYTQAGTTKFEDVPVASWYYDDISIAARAGYFTGTSESTASPEALLTREQATVILSRNLMLQNGTGETLGFSDTRELSDWSRGLVKTATEYGMVKGYPDGTFRPQNNITRGEVASLLVSAIGTPVNQPGTYSLGYTYGNVTISTSGTVLKDTVIAGDLYLTGGVGLGDVTLENVTVLGKIIASGAGGSNKGDASIILRNVTAPQMVVDTPDNQFVTLRSEGDTQIAKVSVRTPAYLEDTTGEGLGLKYIELDGETGTTLHLAGNIKEVLNLTPNSQLTMARGSANLITMDEKALGSVLTVDQGGMVKDLRLDVTTNVGGKGDVDNVTISAGGSTITMMPDNVTIRPGLTANVSGETMNTVTADEASMDPHLLSGYPRAYNIAPVSTGVSVGANKTGTVYWAVSALSDGSVGADELIAPPTYGSKIVKSGNVKITAANQEFTASATGLTSDGSYYLSAVLVDSRGQQSPVKIATFGTPDDTTPAFATGYPYLSRIGNTDAQATVMTTKSCRLYYAVLPKGAAAPKEADFKAAAITGNLGYGSLDVTKSETYPFTVNNKALKELESYDLYLWLNDVSGAKSSVVTKLSFTTVDMTPPTFADPKMTKADLTAVTVSTSMNEDGNVCWVVVPAGTEYPKALAGSGESGTLPLTDLAAKIQVANGSGAFKFGKQAMTANKDTEILISGLANETAYDLYCIAQDKAGNYADAVKMLTINTLDNTAPSATMSFTKFNGNDKSTPTAETDIEILFSERVQDYTSGTKLDELYKAVTDAASDPTAQNLAKEKLGTMLQSLFTFMDITDGNPVPVGVRPGDATSNWVVDYREARVILEGGKTKIILPNGAGLNLRSGSTYQIKIQGVCDSSRNIAGTITFPNFSTVFAIVNMKETNVKTITVGSTDIPIHMSFDMIPVGTSKVADSIDWDMVLWSDTSAKFTLYEKKPGGQWQAVGSNKIIIAGDGVKPIGLSATKRLNLASQPGAVAFSKLNTLTSGETYSYGIVINELEGSAAEATWNKLVNFKVNVVAGSSAKLDVLAESGITPTAWNEHVVTQKRVNNIGSVAEAGSSVIQDTLTLLKAFSDSATPEFKNGRPSFEPTDLNVTMRLMLDRKGTIYYVIAPVGMIGTEFTEPVPAGGSATLTAANWGELPKSGASPILPIKTPGYESIIMDSYSGSNPAIKWGSVEGGPSEIPWRVDGLQANTKYVAYFVIKGSSAVYTESVMCYGFETAEVVRPVITIRNADPAVTVKADRQTALDYVLMTDNTGGALPSPLGQRMLTWTMGTDGNPVFGTSYVADNQVFYDSQYKNMTVLDALTTPVVEGNVDKGSVFDLYASNTAKEEVSVLIRGQSTGGGIRGRGNQVLTANTPTQIDMSQYMSGSNWHIFLAVGKSVAGEGSGDAFSAYRPVKLVDSTPPMVQSVNLSVTPDASGTTYSGTMSLTFTEELYWIEQPDDPSQQQTKRALEYVTDPVSTQPDKFVTLAYIIATGSSPRITIPWQGRPGVRVQVIPFELRAAQNGDQVTILDKVGDAWGNVHSQKPLIATFVVPTDGTAPHITIPENWDASKN